ncbi:MAG: FadR/GntR family transcriptional regulator [Anaerolineales bacterium]
MTGKADILFESVEKSRLSNDIARQVEQAIREGRYLQGDSLPSERELTKIFNVSRPILREALRILEFQGLISIEQGRGSFVKDPSSDILNVPLRAWITENKDYVAEYYEARLAIEPVCAALAAERASAKQIQRLWEIVAPEDGRVDKKLEAASYVPLDIDFHNEIARISGNRYLFLMLKNLIVPETDVRKIVLRIPQHVRTAHLGHIKIIEAIEDRDPEKAKQAMVDALNQPMKAIHQYLSEKEENE